MSTAGEGRVGDEGGPVCDHHSEDDSCGVNEDGSVCDHHSDDGVDVYST